MAGRVKLTLSYLLNPTLEPASMFSFSRRAFLGTALAGLTASTVVSAERPIEKAATGTDDTTGPFSTLFLTWQRDPTTTMTVQWIGPDSETADTKVSYATLKAETWQAHATTVKPYPLTDLKVFRAELTGLVPGTDYQFHIGKQSPTYRFRTMPAKATDTIHFISGGDCGVNPHTVANNVQAARQDPMFALIGGDLAYDNGTSAATNLAFLRNYSKHMRGREGRLIPMLACLGNHEVDGSYHQPRAKAPFFFAVFDGLYRDASYATLEFGDYLSLVLLDTGHITPIAGEQAHWLEKTLKARKDHPHVIVANHVPAYPSYRSMHGEHGTGGTGEANRQHWVPLFENYRVPVVLEHHDHTFKRSKPLLDGIGHSNGVLYLGDGSWGQLRSPQSPEKLTHLAVTSGDYHLSLHRIQGEERFHLALDENGRVMDVCRTAQRRSGLVSVAR
jgi:hypothetical protein